MSTAKKRTIESFFKLPAKKRHIENPTSADETSPAGSTPQSEVLPSNDTTYPFPIPQLPSHITTAISSLPTLEGKAINDQPDLDLLYFQPYIPKSIQEDFFDFLRHELFFYRVQYKIKRGSMETQINTPRLYVPFPLHQVPIYPLLRTQHHSTTVFGVDSTSHFDSSGHLLDAQTHKPIPADRYKSCRPRPIPHCLDLLLKTTETLTCATYNFCLVNYYATGSDSISYHSDDERFLGPNPCIASLSLGVKRDFLMKHKPVPPSTTSSAVAVIAAPLKLPLASGDMVLMMGPTQANWLHSIPKRRGAESDRGRINITFRKALVKGGTENYYNYNVGSGGVYKWDPKRGEMMPWGDVKKGEC